MRKIIILALIISSSLYALGQKKTLKISDPYTNHSIYPARMKMLSWIPQENAYTYLKDSTLIRGIPTTKKADKAFLSLAQIRKDWQSAGLKAPKKFPHLRWYSNTGLHFVSNDTLYNYQPSSGKIKSLCYYPQSSKFIKANPDNPYMVAFTKENNLYIANGEKVSAVTNDEDKGIVSGQVVSRNEFGIEDGIFWSPKGDLLAYYIKDETNVGEYPLVNIDSREATVEMIRYPMAGMASEIIYVAVYNPETKKKVMLDTKKLKEYYFTNITWSPDEKYIYIQVLNREQNHLWLNQYDVATGKMTKTLLEETNDKWVEPEEQIHFLNHSNSQFVFMSERDGYYHAYLCNTEGKIIKQLTKGKWVVTQFLGFNDDNSKMFFMATKDSPLENNLYELNMNNMKISRLTKEAGTHHIKFNYNKTYAIDAFSSLKVASQYDIISVAKKKVVKILQKDSEPLKDYLLGEMSIGTIKADNGTDLYYRLIKPSNFEKGKKYPVIVYVYGGPHAQLVKNSFLGGSGYFLQAMADKGYVIYTLDNRGSANRGFAFESGIHRRLGTLEMRDQMQGIKFLKKLDYVDTNRIGVHGWSFGGFMTTSLMLNHPEVFKVGVAGGPVIDWKYYEVMYGERYMDKPQENPEGYKKSSTLNKVKNLKGRFLIIHGTMDPVVVWQNSQLFVKACVSNQKQLDYFIYPDHEHNVRGKDRLHLETKIAQYFDDFLKK